MVAAVPLMMAATAAISAASAYDQGQQAKASAKYQAQVAESNKTAAMRQASAREELVRRESERQLGKQRAMAAQSGFDPSSGSLLKLQGDSAGAAELDALTARYDGQMQALSFQNEATGARYRASSAGKSGYLNAAGSLLSSYSRYGSSLSFGGN